MWFSKRSFLALAAAASLAGCGFTPVYGPGGSATDLRGALLADAPDNRNAFTYVARIEERLGRAQGPLYALSYRIDTREEGFGVTPAGETTRFNVFGTVHYTVSLLGSDTVLAEGVVENFTGYSATSLIVSTQSVTRDAYERLMVILADQTVTRLIATYPDWRR